MHENELMSSEVADAAYESARHPPQSDVDGKSDITKETPAGTPPVIPKPIFMRLLMLFGGGVGCLLVGLIVSLVTGDLVLLAMSAVLSIAFIVKGFLLRRKISIGQIFSTSGVCVSIVPKMFGRYRRIELVDTATGDDVHFILPKKVTFKVGHVYTCYFDSQISSRPISINNPKGGFINADMDLPTNGFLGFEDFGVYQEKPVLATTATTNTLNGDSAENNEEERNHEASNNN